MKIKHVHKNLYRSDRPRSAKDLGDDVRRLGIEAILTLEEGWSDVFGWNDERDFWTGILKKPFHHIPMSNFWPPSKDECEIALNIIDCYPEGVLVHCFSGVDRTGFVCSYYLWKKGVMSAEEAWQYAVKSGQHWWFRWWKPYFMRICK